MLLACRALWRSLNVEVVQLLPMTLIGPACTIAGASHCKAGFLNKLLSSTAFFPQQAVFLNTTRHEWWFCGDVCAQMFCCEGITLSVMVRCDGVDCCPTCLGRDVHVRMSG